MITHYQRLLDYIKPDVVHVLADGRIVETGGPELALQLEEHGYAWVKDRIAPGEGLSMSALLESMSSGFDALPAALVDAQGLGAPRRAALAAVLADGLPGPRSEAWKYTSLRALSARRFGAGAAAAVDAALLAAIPAPRLVLVNGRFDAALSKFDGLPEGVECSRCRRRSPATIRAPWPCWAAATTAPTSCSPASTPRWPPTARCCAWRPASRWRRRCTWCSSASPPPPISRCTCAT